MPIDYVSTAPWNDPYNPWPLYSQVSLSAIDSNLGDGVMQTLNLVYFDPVSQYLAYSNKALGAGQQIDLELQGTTWAVKYDSDPYYVLPDVARAIPAGWVQGNTNWQEYDGSNVNFLSIIPVITAVAPWEKRRIAGGTG